MDPEWLVAEFANTAVSKVETFLNSPCQPSNYV
jgi:hypothetical protein